MAKPSPVRQRLSRPARPIATTTIAIMPAAHLPPVGQRHRHLHQRRPVRGKHGTDERQKLLSLRGSLRVSPPRRTVRVLVTTHAVASRIGDVWHDHMTCDVMPGSEETIRCVVVSAIIVRQIDRSGRRKRSGTFPSLSLTSEDPAGNDPQQKAGWVRMGRRGIENGVISGPAAAIVSG